MKRHRKKKTPFARFCGKVTFQVVGSINIYILINIVVLIFMFKGPVFGGFDFEKNEVFSRCEKMEVI